MIRRILDRPAWRNGRWLGASTALLAVASTAVALEPTPPQPTDERRPVALQPRLAAPRIIVKYIDFADQRLDSAAAADEAAQDLSDLVGFHIEHVRSMSGNAQVVEVLLPENAQFDNVQASIEATPPRSRAARSSNMPSRTSSTSSAACQ